MAVIGLMIYYYFPFYTLISIPLLDCAWILSLALNLWKITRKDFVPELLLKVNFQDRILSWILGWPDGKDI